MLATLRKLRENNERLRFKKWARDVMELANIILPTQALYGGRTRLL